MSLYELFSTTAALAKLVEASGPPKGREVSDEEWNNSNELLAQLAALDPNIKLH